MYLKITERCNMNCSHCCNSCTTKGKDMSRKVWKAAIQFASDLGGGNLCIGGGEPTLHKDFWEILGYSIGKIEENVWLATNGSQTETAIALANLAKKGAISCALSQDEWHDPIDSRVIHAFTNGKTAYASYGSNDHDAREIRTIKNPFKAGRCKDGKEGCVCEGLLIEPDGKIRGCGCHDAPVYGTVFDPDIPEDDGENDYDNICSTGRN